MAQMYSSPLGAAIHAEPQDWDNTDKIPNIDFDQKTWKINPKMQEKDLKPFDGQPENFTNWWNKIRDHLISCHQPWGRFLDLVERQRVPLTFDYLSRIPHVDGAHLDLKWLAKELWSFLGPRLGQGPYDCRVQTAGGEDRNGLECWRRLFSQNTGGA